VTKQGQNLQGEESEPAVELREMAAQTERAWAGVPPVSKSLPSTTNPFVNTSREEAKNILGYQQMKVKYPATEEEYTQVVEMKAAYLDRLMSEEAKQGREERRKQKLELERQYADASKPKPLLLTKMSD